MSIVLLLLAIFGAGALGGLANAIMSDNGFPLPRNEPTSGGTVLRPGFLGNMLVSGVAGLVSWGLYTPAANWYLVGGSPTTQEKPGLTVAAFVGAILVGVGGSRWLTNEVDKKLLRAAASGAAKRPPDTTLAARLAQATPVEAARSTL